MLASLPLFAFLFSSGATDRKEMSRHCLEAHRILMEIKPENVGKFKDVAQFLAEDLKKSE